MNINRYFSQNRGFTLIEIAVSLIIIGILLGGIVIPISDSFKNSLSKNNIGQLNTVREALIGYMIRNQKLPCPAMNLKDGIAANGCTVSNGTSSVNGFLPWKDLNLSSNDSWGNAMFYAVDEQLTDRVKFLSLVRNNGGNGVVDAINIHGRDNAYAQTDIANSVAFVVGSFGKLGVVYDATTGKLFNKSTGSLTGTLTSDKRPTPTSDEGLNLLSCCQTLPSRRDSSVDYYFRTQLDEPVPTTAATAGPFDDQLVWLSFYQLVGIMTQAGRLQ